MKNKSIFILLLSLVSCTVFKQEKNIEISSLDTAKQYYKFITKEDLHKNLSILASDEYEGRETTKKGQKMAAEYIKNHFKNLNVSPGNKGEYFQSFDVNVTDFTRVIFVLNKDTLNIIDDYYMIGGTKDTILLNKDIIDVNYGIQEDNYNDYSNINVTNKIVVLKQGVPENIKVDFAWNNWRKKVKTAMNNGAIAVITVKNDYEKSVSILKDYLLKPEMKMHYDAKVKNKLIPNICISKDFYKNNIKTSKTIANLSIDIKYKAPSENVLGYIEGRENKDELLVISAHYDHLGFDNGEVCNGADDDGSGTVALMSIAKAFQKAKQEGNGPKRSILFLSVSGEEKGLFGSKYYTDNPVYPLKNTIADLNIDMVGRKDSLHDDYNYIYIIGSDKISKDLHVINEKVNKNHFGFFLDYTYNDENDPNHFYYRSDHYNFAEKGIPVIFYFSGVHEDYHKPTDDVDKINFNKLEKLSRYIYLNAWELVNRDERIENKK